MIAARVLLVDDNPTFLRIATRYLEGHEGISIVAALTTEALASVEELRPDVALVDLAMPDLPGLEVIPRLRAARPELVIIALTLTELIPAIRRAAAASRLRAVPAATRHSGAPVTKEAWPDRSAS